MLVVIRTGVGLSEIIKADTVTGKVSPESAAQKYQIVTRIKTGSGYMIGYMPFGEGDGDEDEMPPDDDGAECDQNDHPGDEDYSDDNGVMGGGFYRAYGYGEGFVEGDDWDGAPDAPDPDRHQAEGDCYSTAA